VGGLLSKQEQRGLTMAGIKCGVVGVGQLGQHHVRIYKELPGVKLEAIHDIDVARMEEIAAAYNARPYKKLDALLDDVDVVSLAVPTKLHFEIGREILLRGKHVLIEKPITEDVDQGKELVAIAHDKKVILYAGHTERFAPALRSALPWIRKPRFVEALRIAGFGRRGTDVSVIHDLMIHDIDLVLSSVDSDIEKVEAIGVPVFTSSVDIANARLSFRDGTIASLTASRVSIERLRKLRFFQADAYISVDFLKRDTRVYRRKVTGTDIPEMPASGMGMQDLVEMIVPPVADEEPLRAEIQDFLRSVNGEKPPDVPGEAGVKALEVVTQIIQDIERRRGLWRA
jgi:predicted dehydrogenase